MYHLRRAAPHASVTHGVTAVAELKPTWVEQQGIPLECHPRRHRRGRIEAHRPQYGTMDGRSVTHGVTAVAELKLHQPCTHSLHLWVTHGVTAVAELKLDSCWNGGRTVVVTHGVTAVAELKHRPSVDDLSSLLVTHGVTAVAELKLHIARLIDAKTCVSPTASPPWPN